MLVDVETKAAKPRCPRCRRYTSKVDHRYQHRVRDNSISGKQAYLNIRKRVLHCNRCDYSFVESLESVHPTHVYTKRFEQRILERCLETTTSSVPRSERLPYDHVRGIYSRIADICIEHLMSFKAEIEILGIDEISIRKGHGDFQTVISNIGAGCVMEVLPDRKKSTAR